MAKLDLSGNAAMKNSEEARQTYVNLLKDENATQEQRETAFHNMFNALQEDISAKISKEARQEMADNQILSARGQHVLTSEERNFFNAVIDGGFNDEQILPYTVVERVFEGLVQDHELLREIGIRNLGPVTRWILSDPTRAFAWKELFGDITGQSNAVFTEESMTQLKLTSYVVVPKDMLELGPEWMERYTRTLLTETLAAGLEYGFINGRGATQKEPIGLMMDVATNGAVTPKVSQGTLTFAPSPYGETVAGELYEVIKYLSVDSDGESVRTAGRVVMVVSPQDRIAVEFRNTIQTANGQWVRALPYNVTLVESHEMPAGKALFFLRDRYLAAVSGDYRLRRYDQTLALEDAELYTIKQFANGRPEDNKSAVVYDLDISFTPDPTPTP